MSINFNEPSFGPTVPEWALKPAEERSAINPDGPLFYIVQAYRCGYDDYQVEGVFSKEEDANGFKAALEASPFIEAACRPQRVPLRTVLDLLVKDRLQELAAPFQTLLDRHLPAKEASEYD